MEHRFVPALSSSPDKGHLDDKPLTKPLTLRMQLPQPVAPFCEALFFFYDCGCRSQDPVICCRAQKHEDPLSAMLLNTPCQHERPTLVVAKLPHACKAGSPGKHVPGESDRCRAEDPGAKKFAREVDTAERLDLLVLDECAQANLDRALPVRVEAPFTLVDVSRKRNEIKNPRHSRSLCPSAVEFVPSSTLPKSRVPATGEIQTADMALLDHDDEPAMNMAVTDKGTDGDKARQFLDADYDVEHDLKHDVEHDVEHDVKHDFDVEHDVEHDAEHDVKHDDEHDDEHDVEHDLKHDVEHDVEHDANVEHYFDVEHDNESDVEHDGESDVEHDIEYDVDYDDEYEVSAPGHVLEGDEELELTAVITTPGTLTPKESISREESTSEGASISKEAPAPEEPTYSYDDMIAVWKMEDTMTEETPATKPWGLSSILGGIFGARNSVKT